jgi:hypothetical protein
LSSNAVTKTRTKSRFAAIAPETVTDSFGLVTAACAKPELASEHYQQRRLCNGKLSPDQSQGARIVTKTKHLMHSQLYLSGRLAGNPDLSQTRKGKLLVKLVLETSLIRETRPGDVQAESVNLPITLFSLPAEQVKDLQKGDPLTIGAHLYGTEFQTADRAIKRGVQIIADADQEARAGI